MNILASRGVLRKFCIAGRVSHLQKRVGNPPDLPKAGFFHYLQQRRVGGVKALWGQRLLLPDHANLRTRGDGTRAVARHSLLLRLTTQAR